MKILLIYPYCLDARTETAEDVGVVPIGVYYIGAMLKKHGHDVRIINWHDAAGRTEQIKQALVKENPDVIGFSILNANRWGGLDIARIAKQALPRVKTVFGGVGATFLWKHFLTRFPDVDFVVLGEGEYTFLNLVNHLENPDAQGLEQVAGLAYRKNNDPARTPESGFVENLDDLPCPAQYFDYQHLALTRGCPGNCTFCGSPKFWKRKVRFHSADYFVDQVETLYNRGINFFYFSDDTFTLKKDLVVEVCKKIVQRGLDIRWNAIARVNHVNEEVIKWMRRAGCIQISYGVESGSETIRNRVLNKKIAARDIKNAFKITTGYGILARAYFIYGCPGENSKTIDQTLKLIGEIRPLICLFYILSLFPGTRLYDEFKAENNVADDIWLNRIESILYFETDNRLSQDRVMKFRRKLRSGYYETLPSFVDRIELVDEEEFYPSHADFLSRLGMTFARGDYAPLYPAKIKDAVAEKLYTRALSYHPDARAYLGLAMYRQGSRDYQSAVKLLTKALKDFPDDEQLNLCMGVSLMNLGRFRDALEPLLKVRHLKDAVYFIANCYRAMNDNENALIFLNKFQEMDKGVT